MATLTRDEIVTAKALSHCVPIVLNRDPISVIVQQPRHEHTATLI